MSLNTEKEDNRYDSFSYFCSKVNKENIEHFRNNNFFRSIVENVNDSFGKEYYDIINAKYSNIISEINWSKIEELSNIGNPQTNEYIFNGNKYNLSNTVLRYILFTFNMLSHIIDNTNIKHLNVIEIGGGFGFQGILFYEMANIFNLDIEKYSIIDLKNVCNLQNTFIMKCKEKYDNYNGLNSVEYNNFTLNSNVNFVISNYCLGELNSYWQNTYIRNIVSKVEHGYFCWNFSPANPKIHSYFNSKKTIKEEETPQTNTPPIKSYIIRY